MSGTYEPPTGAGRPAPSDEEIDRMAADMLGGEDFSGSAQCSFLCQSLENVSDELQELRTAIGQRPPTQQEAKRIRQLIAQMRAINAQMKSLRCPICVFQ
jgi:hypothetical protein